MFVLNPSWEIFIYLFILFLFIYFAIPLLFIYFSPLKVISKDPEYFARRNGESKREREKRETPCHYQDGINTE